MSAVRKNPQEEAYFHKINQELIEKMKEKPANRQQPQAESTSNTEQQGKVLTFDQKKRRAR